MPESDNIPEQTPGAGSSRPSENRTTSGGPRASNAGESLLPGTLIDHRFTLTRLIGRGGMGVVWEAHDTSLGREVALKFLGNEVAADPEAVADLQRETRRSLELTHPNIVRVYDYVEDQDLRLVGISMELLTGRSLQMLKLEQPQRAFLPEKVMPWLRQICIALDYAHQVVGVVHRDLKPGNLFLNDRGTLKIVDFGIAMVMRDSTSRLVQEARLSRSGTLAYMSQQQLKGDKPTPADDLYSLGAVLYELFTSKPPFFRGDAHALMMQIMSQPPMPIAERQAEMGIMDITVPQSWEKAIMACLSKDSAARPTSGGELLSLIEKVVIPIPVGPVPDKNETVVDVDSTRLASDVPLVPPGAVDPEKTMLVGKTPAQPKEPSSPPPLPPPPKAPEKAKITPPPPLVPPPPPPKVKKPSDADAARKEPVVVIHHAEDKDKDKKKGGWGWLSMMGDLLGLKSAVVAGVLLFITGILGWLRSNGAHSLVLKIEPSDVGAQVYVDGRPVGPNPAPNSLKVPNVPDGERRVMVEAKGYKRFESDVTMKDGHGELDVKLLPLVGAIQLSALPGSHVTIQPKDGKPITREVDSTGRLLVGGLPPGEAEVRVEHPDSLVYESGKVPVVPDVTRSVSANQKTLPATVSIKTEPAGANILINGSSRGTAPKVLSDVSADSDVTIEARLDGYEYYRSTYKFKPGERRDLSFELRQIKGSLTVKARRGTRVSANRLGQNAISLGTVGDSGEATFSGMLLPGRWSLVFDNPDCQPSSPTDITIDQTGTATVTARQSLLPGSLDVRSDPSGGAIWINGTNHGNTPNVIEGLPSETPLTIELRVRGRTPTTRTVTLRPRQQSSLIFDRTDPERLTAKLDLQPWDTLRNRKVDISVNGTPVSARSIGGSVFEIPLESSTQYNVHVEAEGFREQSVWVDPVDTRAVRVTLQMAATGLQVVSQTVGAHIFLNDRGPYDSPGNFRDLSPGTYTVRIEKDGFNRFVQQVDVIAGQVRTIGPITLGLSDAPWPGERPTDKRPSVATPTPAPYVNNPTPAPYVNSTPAPAARVDIVPADADDAGAVPLKTTMRNDQIVNSIRSVAKRRGWDVAKIENNVVVLTLKHHGFDATLYCRFDAHHIEFLSDSYKTGLVGSSSAKQVPTSWINNIKGDLTKLVGGK